MPTLAIRKWKTNGEERSAWVVRWKDPTNKHRAKSFQKKQEADKHLAIFTGMRMGEIAALSWGQVDFEHALIRVTQARNSYGEIKKPKTRSGIREIPVPGSVLNELRAWRLASRHAHFAKRNRDDLLFHAGRGISGSAVKPLSGPTFHGTDWKPLLRSIGLIRGDKPTITFHSLRHVAASLFIEQGLPPKRIQQIMGHASITMTFDTYGHLFPDDGAARRASDNIAAQFGR